MKFAGNGATSLFGAKPNNKVYGNTITMLLCRCCLSNKKQAGQGYVGRVFVFNPRATATFSKSVVVEVTKKGYEKVLQRFCTSKKVRHDLAFSRNRKLNRIS
jgi:hypothetical protein